MNRELRMPTTGSVDATTTIRFERDDLSLIVTRWEPSPNAGEVSFVLVHGIGMSSRYFRRLASLLSEVGTVYAVDLPGFGRAPRPDRALTIEAGAELLAEYIQANGLSSTVLIGHSMGAQFVVEVAARYPGLLAALVVIGPVVDERAQAPWQQGMRLMRDGLRESPTANWMVSTDYVRSGLRWYLTELPVMLGYRIEERMPLVAVPVLAVRGSRDPIAPEGWVRRLAGLSPRGRAVTIAGSAHVVQHTAAETVAQTVTDFVASVTPGAVTVPEPLSEQPR
ncbi:MAG: alpha/beta hydrolase [Mycetocola sp.]